MLKMGDAEKISGLDWKVGQVEISRSEINFRVVRHTLREIVRVKIENTKI